MNKDVVYVEPEDDITDIISRIKSSKSKIIALVPPKKLGIMRSAVNIKLIAKTAKAEDKAVVVVTGDPGLNKLAMTSGLPVAKTLNSRPILPSEYKEKEEPDEAIEEEDDLEDETDDEPEKKSTPKRAAASRSNKKVDDEIDDDEIEDELDDEEEKPKRKETKKDLKKKGIKKLPNFDKYQKLIVFGGIGVVALIVLLIWAFGFAPAAKIIVKMKTTANSISENVTLVTSQAAADNKAGKFLLEQIKYEDESSTEFDATGTTAAAKATGTLSVLANFSSKGSVSLPAGATFTYNGRNYVSTESTSLSWDGDITTCDNSDGSLSGVSNGCRQSATVKVQASGTGTDFNANASSDGSGWSSGISGITVFKATAMTGGAEDKKNVVTKDDIEQAKNALTSNSDAKEKLMSQIDESGVITIETSYKVETEDPVSSPKEGESAENGKAKLTAKTVYTIYVVDKTAIDEYITNYEADKLADGEKIYSTGNPFFERFLEGTKGTYTAKLKTTVKTGSTISEADVLEKAKGQKVGEAKARIADISSNISEVEIDTSFPWVRSVPNDENKVTISFEVEGVDNE